MVLCRMHSHAWLQRQEAMKVFTSVATFRPPAKLLIPAVGNSLLLEWGVRGDQLDELNTAEMYTPATHKTSSIMATDVPDCALLQRYSHWPASLTGRRAPNFWE